MPYMIRLALAPSHRRPKHDNGNSHRHRVTIRIPVGWVAAMSPVAAKEIPTLGKPAERIEAENTSQLVATTVNRRQAVT